MTSAEQVTQILANWKNGDESSAERLTPLVYQELRRIARRYLADESAAATLQPTALVHEAYLRLVAQNMPDWESRAHFFGVAAHLMRQILVDHARANRSQKRGGGNAPESLDEAIGFASEQSSQLIALNDALNELANMDTRQARIIELRFFGGFSVQETADLLGISVATVGREQRMAEAWLHRELKQNS